MEKLYNNNRETIEQINEIVVNDIDSKVKIIIKAAEDLSKKNLNEQTIMKRMYANEINTVKKTTPLVFTDGSKTADSAGIGIYISSQTKRNMYWAYKFKLKNNTPITSIEITAIEKALEIAQTNKLKNFIIYTDSQAACEIIKKAKTETYIEKPIYNILKGCEITDAQIRWIPSHMGFEGNEKADQLAKQGLQSDNIIHNQLRIDDAILTIKQKMLEDTRKWYKEMCEKKGKKFEQFQPTFEKIPWHQEIPLSATEIKQTNRILAGHDLAKFWLHKMRIENEGDCTTCFVPETARHKIFECTRYNRDPEISFDNFQRHWKDIDGKLIKKINQFIRDNKIEF